MARPTARRRHVDPRWRRVDRWTEAAFGGEDDALRRARSASRRAGLPAIEVSPSQGRWLAWMARAVGARRILELGTLGGYSTIWLARALGPEGRLLSVEADPRHAAVARRNLEIAGLSRVVEVREGKAEAVLRRLRPSQSVRFDFVFLDSEKSTYPLQFRRLLPLVRPGGWIVADNLVREGKLASLRSSDPRVRGVQRLVRLVAANPNLDASVVQTVGPKGYDGLLIVRVREGRPPRGRRRRAHVPPRRAKVGRSGRDSII